MTEQALVGRLLLRPGKAPAVICERPMIGAALLGRLTAGRHVVLLPDLIGSVFTLCADAQRSTSRRAVNAALGVFDSAAQAQHDALSIAMHVAADHLQRFALDMPSHAAGVASPSPSLAWLRDAPVMALPQGQHSASEQVLRDCAAALPAWLQRRLFGMPVADWLTAWQAERGAWLARWSSTHQHPVTTWLCAVREEAQALAWPCRPLDTLAAGEAGLLELAAALAADPGFAERPLWHGATAETGPWTRTGHPDPVSTAWDRFGARLADLARAASGVPLASGALAVRPGEGLAWTEMSRGLLVHWIQLEPGDSSSGNARAARYHVLAPTEWNFHADGAFARMLAAHSRSPSRVRLAAAALDPCLAFEVITEAGDA